MKYDFDTFADRTGLAGVKELRTALTADDRDKLVSFWGAEFEFRTAPSIRQRLHEWVEQGLVCYTVADDAYLSLVAEWMHSFRRWEIQKDWIVPANGITASFGTLMRALTEPGDGIVTLTPIYHMYWPQVEAAGRRVEQCPMLFDGKQYTIDFAALEQKLAYPRNKILLMCNPHNPTGRVWTREELTRIAALAEQYHIVIFSDEIFAEVIFPGAEMQTYSQLDTTFSQWVVATSLGKAFSFTGANHANIIIADPVLRERFIQQRDTDHYGSLDPLCHAASFGAYCEEGAEWLREMTAYCEENYRVIDRFFQNNIPQLKAVPPEGSYIMWVDARALGNDDTALQALFEQCGLIVDHGSTYFSEPGFFRMNLSIPRSGILKTLEITIARIKEKCGDQRSACYAD